MCTKARILLLLIIMLLFEDGFSSSVSSSRQQDILYLLRHDCGSCHGMTLQGGLGPSLLAQDLQNKSPEYLQSTILNGRTNTAMPPWKDFLSPKEVKWLVQWLLDTKKANHVAE